MKKVVKILVTGCINIDMVIQLDTFPTAGESIMGTNPVYYPGGKGANQGIAVSRLGAEAVYVGRVGDDAWGRKLRESFREDRVSVEGIVVDKSLPTGMGVIMLDRSSGQNRIIGLPGANQAVVPADFDRFLYDGCDIGAVLLQLEIPLETVYAVIRKANSLHIPVILDAAPALSVPLENFRGVTVISPNEVEASQFTGVEIRSEEDARRAAEILREKTRAEYAVVKLGSRGSLILDNEGARIVGPFRVKAVDTTAAGDSFTAALTVCFAGGGSIDDAVRFAGAAGAVAVTRRGAQPSLPTLNEVRALLEEQADSIRIRRL